MTSKRVLGIVLTSAVVAGYAGAAAWSAMAQPSIEVITGYGEGDGLTRYALTTQAGAGNDLLATLEAVPGVASAQWVDDGLALVAVDGVTPDRLRAVPGVDGVELSPSVPVLGTVTDPYAQAYGYNLENTGSNAYGQTAVADADVDATTGWDTGTGTGRVVAVVDSGFDSDHPDLAGSLWTNPRQPCGGTDTDGNGLAGDCHGWNFYTNSADIDNGTLGTHGTSVSGVVGARANNGVGSAGVAPDVRIMPLVIGGGSTVDVNLGARAIRYAVDNGADVINASWGGQFSGPPLTNLQAAIAYAAAHDVLVVAAAGNDRGVNRDSVAMYPASLTDANIVTVGSSTAADTMAAHSDYGPMSVDLFAPGELLPVPWNDGGIRVGSGTSYAAPHVAAAIALYRAVMPDATAAELKAALLADAEPRPAFVGKSVSGGRLTLAGLADLTGDDVRYAFTSTTARPGSVSPTIGISTAVGSGDYTADIGLGMEHQGEIWALADKPVSLDGVTVPTDDAGDARFDLGSIADLDGLALSPSVELAEGRYVLTVQLYRDGEPLGRMHAAPLLVSPTPVPGTPAPTTPGPTTPAPGTPAPGTPTPTPGPVPPGGPVPGLPVAPGPGGSGPGSEPGTPGPGAPSPGTPAPTTPAPGTPAPTTPPPVAPAPSTPAPTTPAPTTPAPTTPAPGTPAPGTPAPTTPAPSTPAPGTPAPGSPAPGSPAPGTPAPPVPGTTTYPEVSAFRITSLSPNVVLVDGGTLVTVTGRALPADPTVRIGASTTADVVESTTTRLVFRVPARVAGAYDVSIYAVDGRSAVLSRALTYADAVGTGPGGTTPAPPAPGDGTPTPAPAPPGGTSPGDGDSPGDGSGTPPAAAPVVRTGPSGERLVRSDRFSALGSIWSLNCSVACTGVAI